MVFFKSEKILAIISFSPHYFFKFFFLDTPLIKPLQFGGSIYMCAGGGSDGKESACNAGDPGSISGLGRSPTWRREWLPAPVFLPGGFHRQRSLAGYIHGVAESDTLEFLCMYMVAHFFSQPVDVLFIFLVIFPSHLILNNFFCYIFKFSNLQSATNPISVSFHLRHYNFHLDKFNLGWKLNLD